MDSTTVISILLALISVCVQRSFSFPVECSVPSNQTLRELHSKLQLSHGALLPSVSSLTVSSEFMHQHVLYGDTHCPADSASGEDDVLEDRSICPWYGIVNHDPARFPSTLVEAKCKCQKCIKNNALECEKVTVVFPVLQQTAVCKDGFYVYEPRQIELAVGCTCASPRTSNPSNDGLPELPFK